jgi:hypothetical protein
VTDLGFRRHFAIVGGDLKFVGHVHGGALDITVWAEKRQKRDSKIRSMDWPKKTRGQKIAQSLLAKKQNGFKKIWEGSKKAL